MKKYKEVVLDLTGCEHVGVIQPRVQKAFGFDRWYGKNWSAFMDYIRFEYPASKVTIIGADTLPSIFDMEMEIFRKALEVVKAEYNSRGVEFEYEFR